MRRSRPYYNARKRPRDLAALSRQSRVPVRQTRGASSVAEDHNEDEEIVCRPRLFIPFKLLDAFLSPTPEKPDTGPWPRTVYPNVNTVARADAFRKLMEMKDKYDRQKMALVYQYLDDSMEILQEVADAVELGFRFAESIARATAEAEELLAQLERGKYPVLSLSVDAGPVTVRASGHWMLVSRWSSLVGRMTEVTVDSASASKVEDDGILPSDGSQCREADGAPGDDQLP